MMKNNTISCRLHPLLQWSFLLFLLEGIVATSLLFNVTSDPESVIFWGLSKNRFILFSFLVLVNLCSYLLDFIFIDKLDELVSVGLTGAGNVI